MSTPPPSERDGVYEVASHPLTPLPSPPLCTDHACGLYRSGPLLSGVVGLIGADSATPLDVEAAAAVLCTILLGRTASSAAKTLQDKTAVNTARAGIGSPAVVIASALLAWKEGTGLMRVRYSSQSPRSFSTQLG